MNLPIPNFSYREIVDMLIKSRDRVVISEEEDSYCKTLILYLKEIESLPGFGTSIPTLHFIRTSIGGKKETLYTIWRYNEWLVEYEKFKIDKDRADKRTAYHDRRKDMIELFSARIKAKMGGPETPDNVVGVIVDSLMRNKSVQFAEQFNITPEEMTLLFEEAPK